MCLKRSCVVACNATVYSGKSGARLAFCGFNCHALPNQDLLKICSISSPQVMPSFFECWTLAPSSEAKLLDSR